MLSEELPKEVTELRCIRGAAQDTSRTSKEISPRHKPLKRGMTKGPGRGYKLAEGGSWKPVTSGNRNKALILLPDVHFQKQWRMFGKKILSGYLKSLD